MTLAKRNRTFPIRHWALTLAAAVPLILVVSGGPASAAAPACGLPTGALSLADLPAGSSVTTCHAVGRVVRHRGLGMTVPKPGTAVGSSELNVDGVDTDFEISVSADGIISYPTEGGGSALEEETVDDAVTAATTACTDGSYNTQDRKEYGTYNWYLGDGGMPGALPKVQAAAAFSDSINNITALYNDCGYTDTVDAKSSYKGETTYESDINNSGDCTDRDGRSTWDAGDLGSNTVAKTCWWTVPTPLVKNDLLEADVEFNTTDFNFTNSVTSSCSGKYDIRSVGTHEAGHVFGLGHVGSGHSTQTMYTNSFICSTSARTLGKGDVAGLRSIY